MTPSVKKRRRMTRFLVSLHANVGTIPAFHFPDWKVGRITARRLPTGSGTLSAAASAGRDAENASQYYDAVFRSR